VLDGACDLAVVTNGTLISCGLQGIFPYALERVDQNNLTKVGPDAVWREDGKMLKPPGYKPVELKDLIEKAKS
jgi:predicted HAD superfamily Cof-like phosphohydrolase